MKVLITTLAGGIPSVMEDLMQWQHLALLKRQSINYLHLNA
jgi:hypothetical protein